MSRFAPFGSLENGTEFHTEGKLWRKIHGDRDHNAITVETSRIFEAANFRPELLVEIRNNANNVLKFPSRALVPVPDKPEQDTGQGESM